MRARSLVGILLVLAILVAIVFPVAWMVISSFRPEDEVASGGLPSSFTLNAYRTLAEHGFWRATVNSFLVAGGAAFASVVLGLFAAYGFGRRRFRGRGVLLFGVVVSQLFPFVMLMTPLYVLFGRLHLLDSYPGLVLADVGITLPFATYMLIGYLEAIPVSLDEAATLDGCGVIGTIMRIILPLTWPGLSAVAIYAFTIAWEEYLLASVLMVSPEKRTLPVALAGLFGEFTTEWSVVMAAATVATLPTLLVFVVLQRRLVAGLTTGAVK